MGYEFKVTPGDLGTAADKLKALSDTGMKAVEYTKNNFDLEGNAGLALKPLMDQVIEMCGKLSNNYSQMSSITSTSATELSKAAKMYQTTDLGVAESLDKTYSSEGEK
ncbi:type VII secretion target [Nocardia carnea]|uniref:type VII secretion target n=1 Tax=Nocardia carnea TaxID=37328 RepID=UPI002458A1F6|nr:type VII secretion target [Nocardia carnea]